jgi:hypothetical protein
MRIHQKHEAKEELIPEKEVNRLKVQNYGKWYLDPSDYNKKVHKIDSNVKRLNAAIGYSY